VRLRYANAVGGKLQPEHHDPNADAPEVRRSARVPYDLVRETIAPANEARGRVQPCMRPVFA
jgi:hypothetical protein